MIVVMVLRVIMIVMIIDDCGDGVESDYGGLVIARVGVW